jgi:hypothetical protein
MFQAVAYTLLHFTLSIEGNILERIRHRTMVIRKRVIVPVSIFVTGFENPVIRNV